MESELNVLEQTNILRIKSAFTKEQCKGIVLEILNFKSKNIFEKISKDANDGCWIGQPHFHNGFTKETEFLLVSTFKKACNEYYKSMPTPLNITKNLSTITEDQWELDAWANVNEPGSINREHTHTGAFVSAVAYFQAEGTGQLQFMPYNYTYKATLPQWPYYGTSYYEPIDGDIILFPSFLLHKVERNLSNIQRINMSFNAFPPTVGDPYARY
jgi:hypothetical protein